MSKRLAWLITLTIIVVSIIYIIGSFPVMPGSHKEGVPAFRYNALPLKFYKGKAEILAKSGYTAYIGQVSRGTAQGKGTLYTQEGNVLYKGRFSGGKYNGKGTLYRENGTKEYSGAFHYDVKQGKGKLYNTNEELIYSGSFSNDSIVYEELVQITTEEVAEHYTGRMLLYENGEDFCAVMPEISALYFAKSGKKRVEEEWMTDGIYVLSEKFVTANEKLKTVKELKKYFGNAQYEGTTILRFADIAAMKHLSEKSGKKYETDVFIETEGELEDARTVTGYSRDVEGYIYTFEKEGFLYTFFAYSKNGGFGFYLIEGV